MPRRVRIISDVHLEFHKDPGHWTEEFCALPAADYLILAGDMCTYKTISVFRDFLKRVSPLYKKIFYVLGNHEYYGIEEWVSASLRKTPRLNLTLMYRIELASISNLVLLDNERYDDGLISVYGTTLWSDIAGMAWLMMRDSDYISRTDYLDKHLAALKGLTKLEPGAVDIVVTHHMPSFEFVDPKYASLGEEKNSGFASSCERFFDRPRKAWVFGHTHTPMRRAVDGVEFICNPVGYPGENATKEDVVYEVT